MAPPKHIETLEGIKYGPRGVLKLLDQRKLPFEMVYDDIKTVQDVHTAIKEMRVRGAPAIAVSAALGVAVHALAELEAKSEKVKTLQDAEAFLLESLDYVETSRPTAVNLHNAVVQLKGRISSHVHRYKEAKELIDYYVLIAEDYFKEDVALNSHIMRYGAKHILKGKPADAKVNILTICNTGALATARYGTALGVIRQLHYDGHLNQVYACETRPWNQGARLTVFECVQEQMPVTLIVDSAASALMSRTKIDAVIVGADRVCNNGDTANKIGTYNLAVAAKYHGVPFYVAAPLTTLDPATPSGDKVTIEEREPTEITHNMATKQRAVAEGPTLSVWNPVFDITPAELITGGLITDAGVLPPARDEPLFNVDQFIAESKLERPV